MKFRKLISQGTLSNEQAAGQLRAVPNRFATPSRLKDVPHGMALLSSLYSQVNTVIPAGEAHRFPKTYYAHR